MKKILILCLFSLFTHAAFGICSSLPTACLVNVTYKDVPQLGGDCKTYSESCLDGYRYIDCGSCNTGYTREQTSFTTPNGCSQSYYYCKANSSGTTCSTSSTGCTPSTAASISNCSTSTTTCFGGKAVRTCTKCATGYRLVSNSLSVSGCSNKYSQKICSLDTQIGDDECSEDIDCGLGGLYTAVTTGYVSANSYSCVRGSCLTQITYKCAPNYYGANPSCLGTTCTGCSPCPEGGITGSGRFSMYGATAITGCYITDGSDTTGVYEYTSNCYYTE